MFMAVIRYGLFWLPNVIFVFLAWLLCMPLAFYSVLKGIDTLPGRWQWFSTVDDTLDGGQHQHPELYPTGVTGRALWWQRACWIARNPAHGWGTRLLGFPTAGMTIVSQETTVNAAYTVTKTVTIMKAANGKIYFSYRRDGSRKLWLGHNPKAYDGLYHQYEFQPFT